MKTCNKENAHVRADNEREENLSPEPREADKTLCANVGNDLGAVLSNTAPPKYTEGKFIQSLRCAIDSLYVSFQGILDSEIEYQLSHLKSFAQHKDPNLNAQAFLPILEHKFEVKPKGAGNFAFVLEDNWFRIQISSSSNKSLPLAYVQIKSELLTFHPLEEVIDELDKVLRMLSSGSCKPNISRLDLCMDFCCKEGFDIETIDIMEWKTRAVQIDRFHQSKRPSGWRIGKGDIMARLYNKTLEIQKSQKDYLKPLWTENDWDGETDVWRLEFQFRQSFFASLNEFSLYMPIAHKIAWIAPTLWQYGATDWLQLVEVNPDDSNTSRWPVHPAWLEFSNNCTFGNPESLQRVRKESIPKDESLFIMGLGAISSFMAREGISDMTEAITEFYLCANKYFADSRDISMETYLREKAGIKTKRYNTLMKDKSHE